MLMLLISTRLTIFVVVVFLISSFLKSENIKLYFPLIINILLALCVKQKKNAHEKKSELTRAMETKPCVLSNDEKYAKKRQKKSSSSNESHLSKHNVLCIKYT